MNQKSINKLTALGMMCALVFVSNYLRITMPIAIGGRTSFTLANIMCCLSGLLLGPVGGVASALGSALYDLTNPAYAAECWITFITKGIMGMVAGFAMKDRATPKYGRCTAAAALGCLAGVMIAPTTSVTPNVMDSVQVNALIACVLGGFQTFYGPILGAYIIAVGTNLLNLYVSSVWGGQLMYLLVLLFIVFRPQGLVGKKFIKKV